MANEIGFKSYCWSIGTTSYRTDNFNMSIELQMKLLQQFRNLPENKEKIWTGNNAFQAILRFIQATEHNCFLKRRCGVRVL